MRVHSCTISPKLKGALAHVSEGKYGRMFPDLPPLEVDETFLRALGRSGAAGGLGLRALGWTGETPLWYYILREAEVQTGGESLGAIGGRIVAEVLLALLEGDSHSYRNVQPNWHPTLPAARPGEFTMADLLAFAGAV